MLKRQIYESGGQKFHRFQNYELIKSLVINPGKILLQTMPIAGFVGLISGMLPKK